MNTFIELKVKSFEKKVKSYFCHYITKIMPLLLPLHVISLL